MPTTQLPTSLVAALRASGAGESAGSVREWIEQGGKGRGDNGLGQVLSAIDTLWHGSPCALPSSSRTEGGRHLRQNSGRSCSLGTANVTQPAQVAVGSGSERPMAVNLPHGGATVAHCAAAATAARRPRALAVWVRLRVPVYSQYMCISSFIYNRCIWVIRRSRIFTYPISPDNTL